MTQILEYHDLESYANPHGKPKWEQAMQHEVDSLEKTHTWDLVPRLTEKNVVKCQWVYRAKFTSDGVVENHKAHLVVKVFSQQEGIDYIETFAPISKMNFV